MKLIDEELGGTTPLDIILTFNSSDELFISIDDEEEGIDDSEFEDEFLDEDIFSSDTSDIWFTEDKIEMISIVHSYLENKNEVILVGTHLEDTLIEKILLVTLIFL